MSGRTPRATLHDVARETGLSASTVSRALSGHRRVSPDLVEQVQRAAARLNYSANRAARALRTSTSTTVGMVVPDIDNPFFPAIVSAVEGALAEQGMSLFLCMANGDAATEAQRLQALAEHEVAGILVSPVHSRLSAAAVERAARRCPVVQIDRTTAVRTDRVLTDQAAGVRAVMSHLRDEGATSVTYIGSDQSSSIADERLTAFRADVSETSVRGDVLHGSMTLEWGREAAARLLAAGRLPDALACENDLIAMGVLQALSDRGVRAPEDVLVTGFDDTAARASVRDLTSVSQPLAHIGAEAVRLLLSADAEPAPARTLQFEPLLIVRRSSARRAERHPEEGPSPTRR